MTRRIVHVALVALCLTALAVPSSAQVFTGRIDVTAKDGTGAILPGVTVELTGTQTANAVTDTRGEVALPQPGARSICLDGQTVRLQRLQERQRPGRRRFDHCAAGDAHRRRRDRESRRHGADAGHRSQAPDRVDERHARRAAEHSVGARPVGRAPDGPRHHRRSRQRRRRGVGPAVGLHGQRRQRRRQHVEHRRHRGDGHGRHRIVADLLRLRHVPGDAGHDGRRGSREPDAGRAAQLRAPQRHQPVARLRPLLLRERRHAVGQRVVAARRGSCRASTASSSTRTTASEGGGPVLRDRVWVWGAYGFTNPAMEINTYRPNAGFVFAHRARDARAPRNCSRTRPAPTTSRRATAPSSRTTRRR